MPAPSSLFALAMTLIAGTAAAHQIVDIKVSVTAPAFVAAGQQFTYQIVADDLANDEAAGVVVTSTLPSSVAYVKASGTGWSCSESRLTVTCTAEEIPVGPNIITIDVTASAASGPLVDSVAVYTIGGALAGP